MNSHEPEPSADEPTKRLIATFRQSTFGGAVPEKYFGRGASSLVFECQYQGKPAAIKIFDPQFLQDNPAAIEQERIRRQLDLKTHPHPHLVQIFDAGFEQSANAHFLIMQRCEGLRLSDALTSIPRDRIRSLISQIADAARHLETREFVHRDIKPDNIIISYDMQHATLLDLGVVLPLGVAESPENTDTLEFVGTPQYSPPEFILRTEESTPDGWRAVTFYQLGAVLHDLIMQRPIFQDKKPKGRLYYSIFMDTPDINRHDAGMDLVTLARHCLKKQPDERLAAVSWEMFDETYAPPTRDQLRERIKAVRGKSPKPALAPAPTPSSLDLDKFAEALKDALISDREVFPAHTFIPRAVDGCVVLCLSASGAHGLQQPLYIALWPEIDEQRTINGIAACAATGNSAIPALMACKSEAASAPVVAVQDAAQVGLHLCTTAVLAACEGAGLEHDGAVVFHLGHYL